MSWRAFVSRNVAELRFIVCPTSQSSAATRYARVLAPWCLCCAWCAGSSMMPHPVCGCHPHVHVLITPVGVVACAAPRAFYEKNYQTIKMLNPRMPFLIRAADNASPRVIARYGALLCSRSDHPAPLLLLNSPWPWRPLHRLEREGGHRA